jgi:hypothetical protein
MPTPRPPRRAFRITLSILDAVLIIFASAAAVILLGGRARAEVWGVRVSLLSAANPLLVAAAAGALRLLIGRGVRLLPSVALPDRTALEAERARFAAPARATRDVWLLAAATFLGSLVWIAPHLIDIRQVPDPGDPLFSAWRIGRLAHQLVNDPGHLFDGNQFHPLPLTLTYSDATFLQGLIGAPFVLAGADALIVANALTLLAFPACGLAFFYAGWRLTSDPRAALIAGLLGAWYPFHAEHYSHLELHWVMFVPLAIVAALRLLAAPGWKTGLAFGAAVAAQWLSSMYVGVMLMSFLVPFVLLAALAWRVRPSWRLAAAAGVAFAIAAPSVIALGVPYMKSREARGERALFEVSDGSALPSDYLDTHIRLASYGWHSRAGNRPERELFPGTTTVALAAAGIVPPLTGATIATLVSAAATFDWSLGLKGLTYHELYKRSVVHRGMRVPARFSVVVGAALALLGAFGARRVLRLGRSPSAQSAICAVLALLVLFDLRLNPRVQPYYATVPSIYGRVTSDMILAELPRLHDVEYMYFSTRHWARLLGGYSGFIPGNPELEAAHRAFPAPEAIDALRRLGATHLTYNCRFEAADRSCAAVLEQLDSNPALELVAGGRWEAGPVRLYRFR